MYNQVTEVIDGITYLGITWGGGVRINIKLN
jgi:hypothetical protein